MEEDKVEGALVANQIYSCLLFQLPALVGFILCLAVKLAGRIKNKAWVFHITGKGP